MTGSQAAASERLAASRRRLREAMEPQRSGDASAAASPRAAGQATWLDSALAHPAVGLLRAVIESWWARHPLRHVGGLSAALAREAVEGAAQRQPLGTVLGAAVVGGGIALVRPWRWVPGPGIVVRWLVPVAMEMLARLPIRSRDAAGPARPEAVRPP